jgi:hypothetical protein
MTFRADGLEALRFSIDTSAMSCRKPLRDLIH